MTKTMIKRLVRRYQSALRNNRIPVTAIYLFGSHARGEPRQGSDIDLCVISRIFGKDDFEEMVKINQIAKRIAPEIEAFPVSEREFKQKSNPFIREALKSGKKIV